MIGQGGRERPEPSRPLRCIRMSQYERLQEERNDKRRHQADRTAAGQKARWTRFAAAKKKKAIASAYWRNRYYAEKKVKKEKGNDYT